MFNSIEGHHLIWGCIVLALLIYFGIRQAIDSRKLAKRKLVINRLILELRHHGINVKVTKGLSTRNGILEFEFVTLEEQERALRNQHNGRILTDANGMEKHEPGIPRGYQHGPPG